MKLADKPCYPIIHEIEVVDNQKGERKFLYPKYIDSLTFRERLVIALASNSAFACVHAENANLIDKDITAQNLIKQADAIIAEMEKEK